MDLRELPSGRVLRGNSLVETIKTAEALIFRAVEMTTFRGEVFFLTKNIRDIMEMIKCQ